MLNIKLQLWQKVLIGMVLGSLLGMFLEDEPNAGDILSKASSFLGIHLTQGEYIVHNLKEGLNYLGILFFTLIKMVVVPIIFFSILNGISSLNNAASFTRIGKKALFSYIFTTAFAVTIGIIAALVFEPGIGIKIDMSQTTHAEHEPIKLTTLLFNVIPSNPIKAMSEGRTLQIVAFAFFTGISLILIGEKGREVRKVIISTTALVFKMIELVIKFTPYGVFGLMAYTVAEYGLDVMVSLGRFVCVVIGALFIQYILFGIMLMVFARLNPFRFYKKILTTQLLAFATVSSKATLATATRELRNRMGVSRQSSSFVLPLGASMNMDATAIYLGICCVFFAQIANIELTGSQYMIIVLTSTIGSIGAAGFPGGSMVMMSMVLSSVGLPLEYIPLILGVDRFLEMLRTMINITGDCTITVIVDKWEGTLNEKNYNDVKI